MRSATHIRDHIKAVKAIATGELKRRDPAAAAIFFARYKAAGDAGLAKAVKTRIARERMVYALRLCRKDPKFKARVRGLTRAWGA